jgi:hypothetical protein
LTLALYDIVVPPYIRVLKNLSACLDHAEAHANETGKPLSALLEARLAPDMHPLPNQIQMASDGAKSTAARLAGIEPPSMADTETTFPELKARIAATIAFLESIKPDQLNGREDAIVALPLPGGKMQFKALDFLTQFAQPNFMFHVVTAYGLLRSQGAPLGKMMFLAGGAPPTTT